VQSRKKAVDTFAERFKHARQKAGLSLSKIADSLGVSPQAVWNYENRADGGLAADRLFPLADVLDVNARWLATGQGDFCDGEQRSSASIKEQRIAKNLAVLTDEKLLALSVVLGIKL
jgi:transcriptional regulator with XRE-family HTH domain